MTRAAPRLLLRWLLLGLLLGLSGCSVFRGQVGLGLGLGAEVKIPGLAHVGAAAGSFSHVGNYYRFGSYFDESTLFILGLPHYEVDSQEVTVGVSLSDIEDAADFLEDWELKVESDEDEVDLPSHFCVGLFPGLIDTHHWQSWSFELNLFLGVIDLRLGFNPVFLFVD